MKKLLFALTVLIMVSPCNNLMLQGYDYHANFSENERYREQYNRENASRIQELQEQANKAREESQHQGRQQIQEQPSVDRPDLPDKPQYNPMDDVPLG